MTISPHILQSYVLFYRVEAMEVFTSNFMLSDAILVYLMSDTCISFNAYKPFLRYVHLNLYITFGTNRTKTVYWSEANTFVLVDAKLQIQIACLSSKFEANFLLFNVNV